MATSATRRFIYGWAMSSIVETEALAVQAVAWTLNWCCRILRAAGVCWRKGCASLVPGKRLRVDGHGAVAFSYSSQVPSCPGTQQAPSTWSFGLAATIGRNLSPLFLTWVEDGTIDHSTHQTPRFPCQLPPARPKEPGT